MPSRLENWKDVVFFFIILMVTLQSNTTGLSEGPFSYLCIYLLFYNLINDPYNKSIWPHFVQTVLVQTYGKCNLFVVGKQLKRQLGISALVNDAPGYCMA